MSADELAEAERWIRYFGATFSKRHGRSVDVLMAEYDRRGAAIERVRERGKRELDEPCCPECVATTHGFLAALAGEDQP